MELTVSVKEEVRIPGQDFFFFFFHIFFFILFLVKFGSILTHLRQFYSWDNHVPMLKILIQFCHPLFLTSFGGIVVRAVRTCANFLKESWVRIPLSGIFFGQFLTILGPFQWVWMLYNAGGGGAPLPFSNLQLQIHLILYQ